MKSVGFHPHEISGTGRSTDSRIGLVRGWGAGGNGESLLNAEQGFFCGRYKCSKIRWW